ncbi:helix-turn-helix domain-containing protein [Dawidia soli]|uniref:Helix-turn-helix domain-containing protein n=1 Tax=Dawidia soli TaxID=2782352 RepID=A0AAP2DDE0_9BACT|nr:helix-turn-helix domain-containing protein [Dawidia soli]MBT1690091.1 helix-turn-helix domain-containing protein [Dawidia soli]
MQVVHVNPAIPVLPLEPDATGNKQFRVYNYEGDFPNPAEFLIPHRKDHYLLVFVKRGTGRHWVDMTPYVFTKNALYFLRPGQIIVKEESKRVWSTGIAFTAEFLSLQNASLNTLPLIQNYYNRHELQLTPADARVVEETLQKIRTEYLLPGEWQQRMLAAHLTVLLTYLSRLYAEQFKEDDTVTTDKQLLADFQAKINDHFRQLHEVSDYASILNISAGHLSDVVKGQSGKPAIKHIHDRLVMEARRMLLHTNQPLKEIAFDLGFSDASYFNRFFKRETGVTPAGYRTNIRKMYH